MLKRLWIVPGYAAFGTWYSLTSNSNGYRIRNIDGIEPVKADINTTNIIKASKTIIIDFIGI